VTATIVRLPRRTVVADTRDDLSAHCTAALELVDDCWPLVSALERVSVELDPRIQHVVRRLGYLLARYERQHLPPEPEPLEAAA
jgi:hypothetical protein